MAVAAASMARSPAGIIAVGAEIIAHPVLIFIHKPAVLPVKTADAACGSVSIIPAMARAGSQRGYCPYGYYHNCSEDSSQCLFHRDSSILFRIVIYDFTYDTNDTAQSIQDSQIFFRKLKPHAGTGAGIDFNFQVLASDSSWSIISCLPAV